VKLRVKDIGDRMKKYLTFITPNPIFQMRGGPKGFALRKSTKSIYVCELK
jgi:hypothetical protein